jgi:hypothetical protein
MNKLDFPLIDFHVHIEDDMTFERVLQLADERGVRVGVVEHAGIGQTIADDDDMNRYIEKLALQPVYKGIQAEGRDWMGAFSEYVVSQLDFVLTDALTFPEKERPRKFNGRLVQLWTPQVEIDDKDDFMERYVDFNIQILSTEPIDIFANPTFLPHCIADEYNELWTEERMKKVIEAAVKSDIAIEINSRYKIPSLAFIKLAKDMGVKFSFGSNTHGEEVGMLEYCLEISKKVGLTRRDLFMP